MFKFKFSAIALLLAVAVPSFAQFFKWGEDKNVTLGVSHPPQFALMVRRIAFGQPAGVCSNDAAQLIDQVILPEFQQNQMDVIERTALDQIMSEHQFNQSAYADATSAVKLGKILGPSALVIVTANGCRPDQLALFRDDKQYNGQVIRTWISKTRYSLEGSIRLVDLTTGQVLGSHSYSSKPEQQNEATNGQPEYPPVDELKDVALKEVKSQIHNMFFPFTDSVRLRFYDDKDCGLKQEYELMHNGDREGAMRLADSNLEQCKAGHKKDKSLARAYYDAAVLHCLKQDYARANELFTGAMENKGAESVSNASETCSQARDGEAALNAYRTRFEQIPVPGPITAGVAEAKATPGTSQEAANLQNSKATAEGSASDIEERLKKLDALYKKGLITKKEYDQKKAEILSQI